MTLQLVLVRHAKSSWTAPYSDDHDRTLNKRGQNDAPKIAKWLDDNGHAPAEVVTSSARRAVETWKHMAQNLPDTALIRRDPGLYHAAAARMMDALQGCASTPVMMIGHNPGIAEFAAQLLGDPPPHTRFDDYPTCATLVAEFDCEDWSEVAFGTGRAVAFTIPSDQ